MPGEPDPSVLPDPYVVTAEEVNFNALFYSEPGIGKTTLAAQAQDHEKMSDVLLLNIEGGTISVAGRGDIAAVDIESIDQFEAVYYELKREDEGRFSSVNTVIIDSASELQQLDLEEIVAGQIEKLERQAEQGDARAKEKLENRSRDDIWLEDYGESSARLKRLFRWFRDMPLNVIITALVKEEYPDSGRNSRASEPQTVRPQLTSSLCESVCGYQDFVWYMYTDGQWDDDDDESNRIRWLLTQKEQPFTAKTRGPNFRQALGRYVVLSDVDNPENDEGLTLPEIYDLLLETEGS